MESPSCETCIHYDACFLNFDDPELPQDELSVYERCCVGCACCGGPDYCMKDSLDGCDMYNEEQQKI